MRRREFIAGLGAAAAWPLAARAQRTPMPVVGFLYGGVPELSASIVAAFRMGLSETGFVEGRNITIEYRFANQDEARLPELAADLISRRVAVIATPGGTPAARAAKALTTTIPIVFSAGIDPVEVGLVASLNRPGGNVTGISSMNAELGAKRLGLLHELLPGAKRFAALVSPFQADPRVAELQVAAAAIGRQIDVVTAANIREIDTAFATLVEKRVNGLLVSPFFLFDNRRVQLVTVPG